MSSRPRDLSGEPGHRTPVAAGASADHRAPKDDAFPNIPPGAAVVLLTAPRTGAGLGSCGHRGLGLALAVSGKEPVTVAAGADA